MKLRRHLRLRTKGVCSVLTVAAALVAVAAAQAAGTGSAAGKCTITVKATHWSIRGGAGSGDQYKVVAEGMSCSVARPWVLKFTSRHSSGLGSTLKGPSGFACKSWSTPASGDKLVYAGVCMHAPGVPFFSWAPRQ
jgi:hypothetical protein